MSHPRWRLYFQDSIAFVALILVLLFRPHGLFDGGERTLYYATIAITVGIFMMLTMGLNIIGLHRPGVLRTCRVLRNRRYLCPFVG